MAEGHLVTIRRVGLSPEAPRICGAVLAELSGHLLKRGVRQNVNRADPISRNHMGSPSSG